MVFVSKGRGTVRHCETRTSKYVSQIWRKWIKLWCCFNYCLDTKIQSERWVKQNVLQAGSCVSWRWIRRGVHIHLLEELSRLYEALFKLFEVRFSFDLLALALFFFFFSPYWVETGTWSPEIKCYKGLWWHLSTS